METRKAEKYVTRENEVMAFILIWVVVWVTVLMALLFIGPLAHAEVYGAVQVREGRYCVAVNAERRICYSAMPLEITDVSHVMLTTDGGCFQYRYDTGEDLGPAEAVACQPLPLPAEVPCNPPECVAQLPPPAEVPVPVSAEVPLPAEVPCNLQGCATQ